MLFRVLRTMFMRTVLKAPIGRFMKVLVAIGKHCAGREQLRTVQDNEKKTVEVSRLYGRKITKMFRKHEHDRSKILATQLLRSFESIHRVKLEGL